MIDFAKLAADTTVATDTAFPTSGSSVARKEADPALVTLITEAAKDHKRRELPGRFSTVAYEGRKGACETQTVVNELHRAARSAGCKLQVRRFDQEADTARLTFKAVTADDATATTKGSK